MSKLKLAIIGSALTILLAGCNLETQDADINETIENGGAYKSEIKQEEPLNKNNSSNQVKNDSGKEDKNNSANEVKNEEMKVLSTYEMKSETANFEKDLDEISQETHENGGFISSNETKTSKNSSKPLRESKITIRVPKKNAEKLVNSIKDKLTINYESLSSVDITDEYYSNNEKLENIDAKEKRLKELYKNAENVSDVIKIEEKISEVEKERDELNRKKFKMDERYSLSRIDLEIKEVEKVSPVKTEKLSGSEKIKKTFGSLTSLISSIFVGLFIVLMWATPVAIIGLLGFFSYKKLKPYLDKKRNIESEDRNKPEDPNE